MFQGGSGAGKEIRTPDIGLEDRYVASTPYPQLFSLLPTDARIKEGDQHHDQDRVDQQAGDVDVIQINHDLDPPNALREQQVLPSWHVWSSILNPTVRTGVA